MQIPVDAAKPFQDTEGIQCILSCKERISTRLARIPVGTPCKKAAPKAGTALVVPGTDRNAGDAGYTPGISSFSSTAIFFSLERARDSICRIRSLVTPNRIPTCSSVSDSVP